MSQSEKVCPFCGNPDCHPTFYDGKEWNPGHLVIGWNRNRQCYEAQIATLQKLLGEAAPIINEIAEGMPLNIPYQKLAQSLLPRIEKARGK